MCRLNFHLARLQLRHLPVQAVLLPQGIDHLQEHRGAGLVVHEAAFDVAVGELEARLEIKQETYTKKIQIEARIFGDLCLNHIIPVATRYQSRLIDNVHKVNEIFPTETAARLSANNLSLIQQISEHSSYITEHAAQLVEARKVANRLESERAKAIAYHDTVAPLIESIRYHVDKLELIVDDELWPLPKYRELLFIR